MNKRAQGTCEWILEDPHFNSWSKGPCPLLWITGGPSKGKTVLATFLTRELSKNCGDNGAVTIFFLCEKYGADNTPLNIVNNLLHQMLQQQPEAFKVIEDDYKSQGKHMFYDDQAGKGRAFTRLWASLTNMVKTVEAAKVFCIIDALDERDQTSLQPFVRSLERIVGSKEGNLHKKFKIMITSQHHPSSMARDLDELGGLRLGLDTHASVEKDLERFIRETVATLTSRFNLSKKESVDLKRQFKDNAQGTFLWVGLMYAHLRDLERSEIEEELRNLPKSLEHLYSHLFRRIKQSRLPKASKLLQVVGAVCRSLTLTELAFLLDQKAVEDRTAEHGVTDQVRFCEGLLYQRGPYVHPIHSTLREFFARSRPEIADNIWMPEQMVHTNIASRCFERIESALGSHGVQQATALFYGSPKVKIEGPHYEKQSCRDPEQAKKAILRNIDDLLYEASAAFVLADYAICFWEFHGAHARSLTSLI